VELNGEIQMLGNAALMELPKTAFLSSRKVRPDAVLRCYDWAAKMRDEGRCVIGGFQSPLERDVLKFLFRGESPIVMVLARAMWRTVPTEYRDAVNVGRMLVVSPFSQRVIRVSIATAAVRNEYVLDNCESAVFASLDPCGSLARLVAARPALNFRVLADTIGGKSSTASKREHLKGSSK
jgi:hypothetical protein